MAALHDKWKAAKNKLLADYKSAKKKALPYGFKLGLGKALDTLEAGKKDPKKAKPKDLNDALTILNKYDTWIKMNMEDGTRTRPEDDLIPKEAAETIRKVILEIATAAKKG